MGPFRGRPSAQLIAEQKRNNMHDYHFFCKICNRAFPRQKSLNSHMRSHLNVRPYKCSFPGCDKDFVQSGQLNTHIWTHTGEKQFICPIEGCKERFVHSNRKCRNHPEEKLIRSEDEIVISENMGPAVIAWLLEEKEKRKQKKMTKRTNQPLLPSPSLSPGATPWFTPPFSMSESRNEMDLLIAQQPPSPTAFLSDGILTPAASSDCSLDLNMSTASSEQLSSNNHYTRWWSEHTSDLPSVKEEQQSAPLSPGLLMQLSTSVSEASNSSGATSSSNRFRIFSPEKTSKPPHHQMLTAPPRILQSIANVPNVKTVSPDVIRGAALLMQLSKNTTRHESQWSWEVTPAGKLLLYL